MNILVLWPDKHPTNEDESFPSYCTCTHAFMLLRVLIFREDEPLHITKRVVHFIEVLRFPLSSKESNSKGKQQRGLVY